MTSLIINTKFDQNSLTVIKTKVLKGSGEQPINRGDVVANFTVCHGDMRSNCLFWFGQMRGMFHICLPFTLANFQIRYLKTLNSIYCKTMQVRKFCPRLGAWSRSKFRKSRSVQRFQQFAWCYRKGLLLCVSDDRFQSCKQICLFV